MDPKPYYEKFTVIRNDTGKEVTGPRFVLIPGGRDQEHIRSALLAYADSCEEENPDLAVDLRDMAL